MKSSIDLAKRKDKFYIDWLSIVENEENFGCILIENRCWWLQIGIERFLSHLNTNSESKGKQKKTARR